jgi:putative transposase
MLCRVAERWHQAMKNRVLLEYYYLTGDLERQIGSFVYHYKHRRDHDSLKMSEEIKKQTIRKRRLQHKVATA